MRVAVPASACAMMLGLAAFPAAAQVAVYTSGTIYDLDPPADQSAPADEAAGAGGIQPVRELHDRDVYRIGARAVGRLAGETDEGGTIFCTASVIAADLVLTTHRCGTDPRRALLSMGYLTPGDRGGVASYHVALPAVEADADLDYAILRVHGPVGRDWGTVSLAPDAPKTADGLYLVQHPDGGAQSITIDGCRLTAPITDADTLTHTCATRPGAAGAPLFDMGSRRMVAMHTGQDPSGGSAIPLGALAAASPVIAGLLPAPPTAVAAAASGAPPREPEVAGPAPTADALAAKTWESLRESRSVRVLEFFANQYQGTAFAALAEERITALREGRADPPAPDAAASAKTPPRSDGPTPGEAEATATAILSPPAGSQSSGRRSNGAEAAATEASEPLSAVDEATTAEAAGVVAIASDPPGATGSAPGGPAIAVSATRTSAPPVDETPGGGDAPTFVRTDAAEGWATYRISDDAGAPTCYALAAPERKAPDWAPHGDVWFFVTTRPQRGLRELPSFALGIDLAPATPVALTIEDQAFALTARGGNAFPADAATADAVVDALRKGGRLTVTATTVQGIVWHYRFALEGLGEALQKVATDCP